MDAAADLKERGTSAFKDGEWNTAKECYEKGEMYVGSLARGSVFFSCSCFLRPRESALLAIADVEAAKAAGSVSEDEDSACAAMKTSCHLNICLCGLKSGSWEEVFSHASSVISNDPNNVKGKISTFSLASR